MLRLVKKNIEVRIYPTKMDKNDFKTAIIVSDPLHMKRAMKMAENCNLTAFSSPTPTTMYKTNKTQIPFAAREVLLYVGYSIISIFK